MTGISWAEGVPLGPLTSWRIGGPCRAYAKPKTPEELTAIRREATRVGWPVFLLGGGTNLLISDDGYPGVVIRYSGRGWQIDKRGDEAIVRAGAGASLSQLARQTATNGWSGLAWAEGIPGTVAGAAVGNAGAYGGDIASSIESLQIVHPDGLAEDWAPERMIYTYRSSTLKGRDPAGPAVVGVSFRLRRDDPKRLTAEVERIAAERQAKNPPGATAGSVFRNPTGSAAGRLIDEAGCKGLRVGGAVVSEQHANYIINEGNATARDVVDLIEQVRSRVREASGVSLELEVLPIGFDEPI